MGNRSMVWLGMIVGSMLGGFVPLLWGGSAFSFAGIIWNAIGGFVGIYVGYKFSNG